MDTLDGHGGTLATGVRSGQAEEDCPGSYEEKPGIPNAESDQPPQENGEVEAEWGNPGAYAGAKRTSTPTRAEVEQELAALSRGPFQQILADYLGFAPTPTAIRRFAERYPDKYVFALGVIAQLAGYKKDEVVVNNYMMVGNMSDYEINKRRLELQKQEQEESRLIEAAEEPRQMEVSRKLDPDTIDVQAREVRDGS